MIHINAAGYRAKYCSMSFNEGIIIIDMSDFFKEIVEVRKYCRTDS